MYKIKEYENRPGNSPFDRWFHGLESNAAAKITVALNRLKQGIFTNVNTVREGVFEYRINAGPGYRIYFGQEGSALIVLLTGGTKSSQRRDIDRAVNLWQEYKSRSQRG